MDKRSSICQDLIIDIGLGLKLHQNTTEHIVGPKNQSPDCPYLKKSNSQKIQK